MLTIKKKNNKIYLAEMDNINMEIRFTYKIPRA